MFRRTLIAAALVSALTIAVIAAIAAPVASSATSSADSFDRTLTVGAQPIVSVSTDSGYIHVASGAPGQIHVVAHVRIHPGWFSAESNDRVQQIVAHPPIAQTGNIVTIGTHDGSSGLFHNISIDYDVILPRATTLKAHAGSGDLHIEGIEGAVDANSISGSIQADDIGPNARLQTGSGPIRASSVHGAAVLQTGSGNLQLSLTAPGDVQARTGSGSIHIDGIDGGLRAGAGSGSIEVSGNPTSEWRLESGSGAIHLQLAENAHFTLNAQTGSGSVDIEQPIVMQGSINRRRVSGTVNGGGPTIRANTGSGNITVRRSTNP